MVVRVPPGMRRPTARPTLSVAVVVPVAHGRIVGKSKNKESASCREMRMYTYIRAAAAAANAMAFCVREPSDAML